MVCGWNLNRDQRNATTRQKCRVEENNFLPLPDYILQNDRLREYFVSHGILSARIFQVQDAINGIIAGVVN